jgi:CRP-like cAMP-binding protein
MRPYLDASDQPSGRGGDVRESELVDDLAAFALFADLSTPELEAIAHTFEEEMFPQGQRVLRQGFSGSSFYVILDGEAGVRIDGEERARLGRGDFFGEVSILLQESPLADVVALTPLRCLALPGPLLQEWLLSKPTVTLRMLQAELRRLRTANTWRS